MKGSTGISWSAAIAGGVLAIALAAPAMSAEMTQERKENPNAEPQNWILHHQNYEAHRYSMLDKISKSNVQNMKVAYALSIGGIEGAGRYGYASLEGTPLVEDGMMYVPNGWGTVYKIDVSDPNSATFVWAMDPGTDKTWSADVACCGVDNRGVALWKDQVISITLDGRLVATNKDTGEISWERPIADPGIAETLTVAPQVVRDIAIVGPAGAEFGIRGWLDATDLNTGERVWRTHTVPGPGEPGNETWTDDYDAWDTGGGSIWVTGSYDPALNLVYWGTGNPGPDWDAEYRPGDNLYTDSVLAMSPDDGSIKWYFQYTPNDPYDYDEIGEHHIVDVEVGGEMRKTLLHAGRNGFMYGFDRATGEFLYATQYVDVVNWTDGIDPKTGLPTNYDPNLQIQAYKPGTAARRDGTIGTQCPLITGGKNWEPAAYNPDLQRLYIQGGESCHQRQTVTQEHPVRKGGTVKARDRFVGGKGPDGGPQPTDFPLRDKGSVKAVDARTGETVARIDNDYFSRSGVLATAGELVFYGEVDGWFHAVHADTMQELWSFNVGASIKAPAITWEAGGTQFIGVLSSTAPGGSAKRVNPALEHFSATQMLWVFSL